MFTRWRKTYVDLRSSALSHLIRGAKSVSGGTAIEFAFAAPVLFMFMFGTIEFGRAMFTQSIMQYALYEAARYAVVNENATTSAIKDKATERFILIDPSKVSSFTVTTVYNGDQTNLLTLQISYVFDFLVPMISTQPMTLTAASEMVVKM